MKRALSLALTLLFAALLLAGCGGTDPVGHYVLKTIDGVSVEQSLMKDMGEDAKLADILQLLGMDSVDDYMTIDLKSDGSAVVAVMIDDRTEATWKQEGDKIVITPDDGSESEEIAIKGNELSFRADGQDLVFVKQ